MNTSDLVADLLAVGSVGLTAVLDKLLPQLPVEQLVKIADKLAAAILAKSPAEQVHDAEDAIEAEGDIEETATLKAFK